MTIYGVTYFFSCGYTHDFFCTRLTDEIGFTLFVGEMLPKLLMGASCIIIYAP